MSDEQVDTTALLGFRSLLAGALGLATIAAVRSWRTRREGRRLQVGPPALTRRGMAQAFLLGALVLGPSYVVYYTAFSRINTSIGVAIAFAYPPLVLLILAAVHRSAPRRRDIVLSCLALAGVVLLSAPGASSGVTGAGVAMVAVSTVGYALYVVLAGALAPAEDPLVTAAFVTGGAGLTALLTAVARGGVTMPDAASLAVIGVMAVLTLVAMSAYYVGIAVLGAVRASLLDAAQPVVAVVVGTLWLGERLVALQFLGITVVIAAVVSSSRQQDVRVEVTGDATVPLGDNLVPQVGALAHSSTRHSARET